MAGCDVVTCCIGRYRMCIQQGNGYRIRELAGRAGSRWDDCVYNDCSSFSGVPMYTDNVIWVDFRLSKDIRTCQVLSFRERMRGRSERTQQNIRSTQSALDLLRAKLNSDPVSRPPDKG